MFIYECDACHHRISVPDELAGTQTNCPNCNQVITFPPPAPGTAPVYAQRRPQQNPFGPPAAESNLAMASVILGALSFVACSFFASIPGIITGHMAMAEMKREPAKANRRGLAIAGLLLSYANITLNLVAAGLIFIMFATVGLTGMMGMDSMAKDMCRMTLSSVSEALGTYSRQNDGQYPPLSPFPGDLTFSPESKDALLEIEPDLRYDMTCDAKQMTSTPFDDDFGNSSGSTYVYLGYAIESEEQLDTFVSAYDEHLTTGLPFDADLLVAEGKGTGGGNMILRLTDFKETPGRKVNLAKTPVLIDWPENHDNEGANVLFLDGHVEFVTYPGKWPMTEHTIQVLQDLKAR